MRCLVFIFCFVVSAVYAQDKIYFKNGRVQNGMLLSVGGEHLFFRKNDTSAVEKIALAEVVMAVDYRGTRYIISGTYDDKLPHNKNINPVAGRNFFGIQPLGAVMGRAGLAYERLSNSGKMGIVIPFIITFNPYRMNSDTNNAPGFNSTGNINFIGGLDLNFYLGNQNNLRYFFGPRIRHGTDVLLNNIEGTTVQTQFGVRYGENKKINHHISFGVGFLNIRSGSFMASGITKHYFGSLSFNYRLSYRW